MRTDWLEKHQNKILAYRNTNGTFAKGNPGGPGRPTIQQLKERQKMILAEQIAYEEYILSQQSPEVRDLVEKAMNGDLSAIKKVWHLF